VTLSRAGRLRLRIELSPLTIALLYGAVSAGWILFTDQLLRLLPDRAVADQLQSLKATGFVAVTAGLVFLLIRRYRTRLIAEAEARATHERQREQLTRALDRLTPGSTAESTARRICRAMARLPDIALSVCFVVDGGDVLPLAAVGRLPVGWRRARPLHGELAAELRERAAHGAWTTSSPAPADPRGTSVLGAELAASSYAEGIAIPVRHAGALVAILLAAGRGNATEGACPTRQLPTILGLARVSGAWLGPGLAARHDLDRRRSELRRAMAGLRVVFQPVVALSDGRIVGHEALSRFADGAPPAARFAEATALGLGIELEALAIARAIEAARALRGDGWLSLNLSPDLLLAGSRVSDLLAAADGPVVLELTERQAIADYAAVRRAVDALTPTARLAIDDIGEGFASLRHLLELGPAFIKLDVALVRGIDVDLARQALVAGLRHYAVLTGAELIAEGIETRAEQDTLCALGATLGQGYLFGRPLPAKHITHARARANRVSRKSRAGTAEPRVSAAPA
jgi:EAL domain-containing protein (putative c-di-GMP-specific phosphodiesterase class I)